jgi:hypothetical protein
MLYVAERYASKVFLGETKARNSGLDSRPCPLHRSALVTRPGLTHQVVAPYVPGFLKHPPPRPCRAAWHCSQVWKPQWWCPWLLKQYRGAKDFVALKAWAGFDEGIVMSTTVPAIVARPRILLAVDMVTRIWPSQSVDSAPALRCARATHTTFDRSGHLAPHGSRSFLATLRGQSASGPQSNSFTSMP